MLNCMCWFMSSQIMCSLSILQIIIRCMAWPHKSVKMMTMQKVNKQLQAWAYYPLIGWSCCKESIWNRWRTKSCHPAPTHPTASAINSAVITNNGICQRSVSYLSGLFDNRVISGNDWWDLYHVKDTQGYLRTGFRKNSSLSDEVLFEGKTTMLDKVFVGRGNAFFFFLQQLLCDKKNVHNQT